MNRTSQGTLLPCTILVAAVLSGAAFAGEAPKSEYTIPAELTPVSKWAKGFTAAEAEECRLAYSAADYVVGNDITAFANKQVLS